MALKNLLTALNALWTIERKEKHHWQKIKKNSYDTVLLFLALRRDNKVNNCIMSGSYIIYSKNRIIVSLQKGDPAVMYAKKH